MNPFSDLNFRQINVRHHNSNVLAATLLGVTLTRDQIKNYAQRLSNKLHEEGKDVGIAVAIHYKKSNLWDGGEYTSAGDEVSIHDPSDSVHGRIARDDTIDGVQVYIIKN